VTASTGAPPVVGPPPRRCELCPDPVDIEPGVRLVLRHSAPADGPQIEQLYRRLPVEDLLMRFFSAGMPPDSFFERWSSLAAGQGLGLVAELTDDDGTRLVGEAGYSVQDDGDAELGIAVDPGYRGWIGPWILAALLDHAHDRGIHNMQALVRSDNRPMISLAQHRGFAVLEHPDWGTVRLTMSTAGHTPSWPPIRRRPRVLVAAERTRWPGEEQLRQSGFDLAICPGLHDIESRSHAAFCPAKRDGRCPLVAGADAVVVDLPTVDPRYAAVRDYLQRIHPEARVVDAYSDGVSGPSRRRNPAELIDEVRRAVRG
jgi:RimJ/RimL family protein N-acetyltransferase